MGGMSYIHWLIVLAVVIVIFGTKKLANMGSDLGKAVKGFKDGIKGDEEKAPAAPANPPQVAEKMTVDVDAKEKSKS